MKIQKQLHLKSKTMTTNSKGYSWLIKLSFLHKEYEFKGKKKCFPIVKKTFGSHFSTFILLQFKEIEIFIIIQYAAITSKKCTF